MMNLRLFFILLLLPMPVLAQDCSYENDTVEARIAAFHELFIRPFSTDLCTGYKEGKKNNKQLWADCCTLHDLRFWAGGDHQDRVRADKMLFECVRDKGAPGHAKLIWLGVKIGGLSPIKLKAKQWGNAWGNKVRKQTLSEYDIDILETSLRLESNLNEIQIKTFIDELKGKK